MTELGAVVSVDPLVGEVVINELADALAILTVAMASSNSVKRLIFNSFTSHLNLDSHLSSHFFRLRFYPREGLFPHTIGSSCAHLSVCM